MLILSKEQERFVKDVAQNNGFSNFKIEITGTLAKGDNFLAKIHFITIKEQENTKILNLVFKSAHKNEDLRKQLSLRDVYLREIYMYETLLPEFLTLQKETGVRSPFQSIAKLYGVFENEKEESLLLENMKESGYRLWNRKIPMDGDHIEAVFKVYAKLHAISFAFKKINPEKFDELTKNLTDVFFKQDRYKEPNYKAWTKRNFVKAYDALGDHPAKKVLEEFEIGQEKFFTDEINSEKEYFVVTHGDCWCNNIMFEYKDNSNKPTNVCIVDWQISKLGSPVLDLSYFFYVCAGKDEMQNLQKYLKVYHDTFSQNLRDFGCDPEKIYSWKVLQSQWKRLSKNGLLMAFNLFPIMVRDSEDSHDLGELAEEGRDFAEAFDVKALNADVEKKYKQRLSDLIIFLAENEYL